MLPEVDIPKTHTYEHIRSLARDKARAKTPKAALVVPSHAATLKAFMLAHTDGLLTPVIVGDQELLNKTASETDVDVSVAEVLDINQPDMAVATAAKMAEKGDIDLIVQGRVPVKDMLTGLLNDKAAFRLKGKLISHVAVLKPAKYPKLLLLSDSAVVVEPDLKAKLGLIDNLARVAHTIGIDCPRVAVLGAVEVIYPQMKATMDAAVLGKMSERHQIKGAQVDGPLSFDIAVDMFAAHSKGVTTSTVAGQADGMIAPTIEVANGIYNAMTLYGTCDIGGVMVGGRVPIAVNSRADSEAARYNSIALAVLAG